MKNSEAIKSEQNITYGLHRWLSRKESARQMQQIQETWVQSLDGGGGFADSSVAAALDTIRRKACEGLKAADVVRSFRCPRRQAEIRFRRATGHSILEEIHIARLARAKELLENSDMQLEAVAGFCGFETPNALRKFFLAQTGMTMSAWRKTHARASAKASLKAVF